MRTVWAQPSLQSDVRDDARPPLAWIAPAGGAHCVSRRVAGSPKDDDRAQAEQSLGAPVAPRGLGLVLTHACMHIRQTKPKPKPRTKADRNGSYLWEALGT